MSRTESMLFVEAPEAEKTYWGIMEPGPDIEQRIDKTTGIRLGAALLSLLLSTTDSGSLYKRS